MWKFVCSEPHVAQVSSHPLNSVETEGGLDKLITAEGTLSPAVFYFSL